jgi:hypothetical protein
VAGAQPVNQMAAKAAVSSHAELSMQSVGRGRQDCSRAVRISILR